MSEPCPGERGGGERSTEGSEGAACNLKRTQKNGAGGGLREGSHGTEAWLGAARALQVTRVELPLAPALPASPMRQKARPMARRPASRMLSMTYGEEG